LVKTEPDLRLQMRYNSIADILNEEKIAIPSDYQYQRLGRLNPHNTSHLWGNINVKRILNNPIYIGTLAQLRTTSVSYKNHKIIQKNKRDWAVIKNNHEPIVSQDLWNKCREVDQSVSHGKRERDFDEFIRRLKKYAGAEVLTRQICLDLIGYITVDENHKNRTEPRKSISTTSFLIRDLRTKQTPLFDGWANI
jgi:hypothetical protein